MTAEEGDRIDRLKDQVQKLTEELHISNVKNQAEITLIRRVCRERHGASSKAIGDLQDDAGQTVTFMERLKGSWAVIAMLVIAALTVATRYIH